MEGVKSQVDIMEGKMQLGFQRIVKRFELTAGFDFGIVQQHGQLRFNVIVGQVGNIADERNGEVQLANPVVRLFFRSEVGEIDAAVGKNDVVQRKMKGVLMFGGFFRRGLFTQPGEIGKVEFLLAEQFDIDVGIIQFDPIEDQRPVQGLNAG